MLTDSPVARSASVRALFLASAAVTVAIYLWTDHIYSRVGDFALTAVYNWLFLHYDGQAAAGLAIILILAALVARPGWLNRVAGWVSDHTLAIAAGVAVLLSAGSLYIYGHDPFTYDEFSPFFQAQVFASGHLAGYYPPELIDWLIPPYFQHSFLEFSRTTGEVASGYWPSFALLLVPFIWLGMPWACNPVISALTLLVVRRLALELFQDREAAGLAVLFTVASPVLFGLGTSYYSEPAHLLTDAVYALLLIQPNPRRAAAAGLVGSIALTLHNPFPHFLFAIPWLGWLVWQQRGIRLLVCLGMGYLPLTLLLGLGWPLFVNGLPHGGLSLRPDILSWTGNPANPVLFTLVPRLGILYARLIGLAKVWAWAVPGIVILACVGARKTWGDVRCRLLAASTLTTLVGYLFAGVDQGHGWGFRYFHGAWFVLPLFAAAALTRSITAEGPTTSFANDDVRAFITACALLTLVAGVGQRALQIDDFVSSEVDQGPRYRGHDARVVIYRSQGSPWGNVLPHNSPWLRDRVLHVFSHGREADAAMMRALFPALRNVYRDQFGSVWAPRPPGQPDAPTSSGATLHATAPST